MKKSEEFIFKDERMKAPKFVLISEIDIEKEKVLALRNVISAIWEKVEDVSTDKQLEFIKRKLHTDFIKHEPQTFNRDIEDYIWDILFNNK